jgi:hypothetical protein
MGDLQSAEYRCTKPAFAIPWSPSYPPAIGGGVRSDSAAVAEVASNSDGARRGLNFLREVHNFIVLRRWETGCPLPSQEGVKCQGSRKAPFGFSGRSSQIFRGFRVPVPASRAWQAETRRPPTSAARAPYETLAALKKQTAPLNTPAPLAGRPGLRWSGCRGGRGGRRG